MEKLVLIDGNSLINRAFYAMPPLVTKDGIATNAVYGFMNMFFKMLAEQKPTYVAVAFDMKAPTFRHKIYSDYKGTRKPMPEELRPQIPLLKEVLTLMGVTCIEKQGSEADDIIGTIAKATDVATIIYTGDKDALQLVDEQTSVFFTKRGITDIDVYDLNNFTEMTGLIPSQIIDLKALMGDSSDNIPGIAGVGEKTAKTLIQTYQTVDGVYAHVDELKGKLREKVEQGKDSAYLSKTLATIDTDCGVRTDIENMTVKFPLSYQVKKKFLSLEFKSLAKKDELFEQNEINELGQQDDAEEQINLSVRVESSSDLALLDKVKGELLSVAFTDALLAIYDVQNQVEYDLKLMGASLLDDGATRSDAFSYLNQNFGTRKLIVFNKKDLKHFYKSALNQEFNVACDDVALMKYVADYTGKEEKLVDCLAEYGYEQLPIAYALYLVYGKLIKKLKEQDTEKLYYEMELPLADVLYQMEEDGFKVDYDSLSETGKDYKERLNALESQIKQLVGEPDLNVNSPKQLGDIIFGKLNLGKGKKNKKGFSTSAEILEALEDVHPVIPLILAHRQLSKLHSTYVEGMKPLIDKNTGLIHTSFNQTVTATGRLSSKEPNLQNIPVREDEGRELRKLFVPKNANGVLISADYSQIELRLLAAFSNCKSLIDAFNSGTDVHSITASKVFGVSIDQVTPLMRRNAKAVNFGIIYGISEYGLAKNLKISSFKAREYIDSYFKQYPEVKEYMDKNVEFAKENGYAVTMFGRRRYVRELKSANYNLRQFGERVAMNMPLQGSSADIIKLAMSNVFARLKKEGLKTQLILQVHDELILDATMEESERAGQILKEEMEGVVNLPVKLTVDVGKGKTWFDAK